MPLIHYVLLKFHPGALSDELFAETKSTFFHLEQELPGVHAVTVHRNRVDRPGNFDILIRMELENQELLKAYLAHPLHLDYARKHSGLIAARASFDCAAE